MSLKRIIARNGIWSVAGMAGGVITGFITAPFLVHRLGQTTYGMWVLIVAMTSYLNLIDLGLRASITRHVAYFRAKGDMESVNKIVNTAMAILLAASVLALLGTFILIAVITRLNKVPADQLHSVQLAMLLAGLTISCILALSTFDSVLWAYERFDLLNGCEIAVDIVQTSVLLFLVAHGGSLVTIAAVVFVGTLGMEIAKMVLCLRMDRQLRINPRSTSAWAARYLFGYGFWKFVWSIGNRATAQSGPLIIGARLSPDIITRYTVGARVVDYAKAISSSGTAILTPTATALHAGERHGQQQRLFLEGGKYCFAISLFFVCAIILLGKPFITLWMGAALAASAAAATVLALGEILPVSQWVTNSILLGRDRHRVVACACIIETLVVISLGLILARRMGLLGVCIAIAVPGMLCRGLLPMIYGCFVMKVPLWRYVARVLAPPILAMAIPAAGMAALVYEHQPQNWFELFGYGGIFGLTYFFTCCAFVVGPEQVKGFAAQFKATAGQILTSS